MFLIYDTFYEADPYFLALQPPGESLCKCCQPAARYMRLSVFQLMDPSGVMKSISYISSEFLNSFLCVCA